MEFEWDEAKRLRTLTERGLDFADAESLFDGRLLVTFSTPREDEARFASIGVLKGETVTLIWVDRGERRRVVSMRRAKREEAWQYRELLDRGTSGNEV